MLFLILVIVLSLSGYIFVCSVVYALCIYLDVGVSHFTSLDDKSNAACIAAFWPFCVWAILAIYFAKKFEGVAVRMRAKKLEKDPS